jgi:hypothetical protein
VVASGSAATLRGIIHSPSQLGINRLNIGDAVAVGVVIVVVVVVVVAVIVVVVQGIQNNPKSRVTPTRGATGDGLI